MYRFLITILSLIALGISDLSAQNVLFFNSKQGLSNSCIHNIYEDSRHNIWIATQNGLNRYDGLKMNAYRHDDKVKSSLMHDDATFVSEYDHDHILVGTVAGLQMFDYATNSFAQIPLIGEKGDTTQARITQVKRIKDEGKDRVVVAFAGYGNGEVFFREDGSMYCKRIQDYHANDDDYYATQTLQDSKNNLWFILSSHHIYRKVGGKLKLVPGINNPLRIIESAMGNIYAATNKDGLYKFDAKTNSFVLVASGEKFGSSVCSINAWRDSRIFVCTDGGGLRIYDEKTGEVTLSNININNFDLTTSNVKDAICDTYGNVWVGIYWMGVMMKPHNQTSFDYVGRNSITKNTIGSKSVLAIAPADDSHIWVAPDNDGLYLMENDGTSSEHFSPQKYNIPTSFTTVAPLSQMFGNGGGKDNAANGPVLLGSFNDGLWQMQNGQFSLITKDINQIFEIKPADKGNVWIATIGNGFYYYNPTTHQYIRYAPEWSKGADANWIIGNPYVFSILQHKDYVYVATADGLNVCHHRGDGIINERSKKLISGYAVKHIAASDDGKTMWFATDNGLFSVDVATLKQKQYRTSDGLANNGVKSIYVEGDKLWISTDNGISLLDTKSGEFTNFFADDGLQDNEFNRGAVLSYAGNLYFGGISGLTYFNTKTIEKRQNETVKLKLRLVDLLISGKVMHKGDLSGGYDVLDGVLDDCSEIDLSNHDNHFILELCVEGLSNQHVNYEYSIDGSDWIDQGGSSSRIIFDNLKPGKYKIRLRALALGAVSEEREIIVHIHPAWYASWWAQIIYFLLFALLCYLAYLYVHRQVRARKILARHRQQQEINEARIQFFMNISHEIRTPMTLILAPLERLIRTDKDEERQHNYNLIKQNSNRILRLINQMMDVRKIEQGKYQLDYHKVELVSLLQNIFEVFSGKAQGHNIEYAFEHDDISSLTAIVDPENVDKMVMNLLSNAFKFTPDGGKVTLQLTAPQGASAVSVEGEENLTDKFVIKVTDTGCGISDGEKKKVFDRFYSASHKNGYIGTGIGLNLTSMLVRLHKGSIKVVDNPEGKGSQFVIECPLRPADISNVPVAEPIVENVAETHKDEMTPFATIADAKRGEGHLILVEDDASIREYVSSELSRDFKVHEFIDGQKAWDYIVAHPNESDLIISDIMMPVMDGLTLCQKVKSNFNTNHIPILLMTALGSDADRIVGITNGADAYISKPFNIDVLQSTALGLLRNRLLLKGRFKGEKVQQEETEQIEIESPDEQFLKRVMKVINDNIDNDELSVEMIADKVGISRVHFYRKMKDLTGQGPREYMKYVRLKEAARLLSKKKMDITGVSIACGFKTVSSFSTSFKALYGITPTEWMKKNIGEGNE